MYMRNLPGQLSALALVFQSSWLLSASASAIASDKSLTLKPIHVADFESSFGIQRRTAEDFSDLNLKTQEQLVYGRPGEQGQLLLANMTLYGPGGLPIILMERFEGLTSTVDCKGDDGSMSLTFKTEAAFQHALKTWGFINESKEKQFLLIANHDGCGPDDERQPYLISGIREDAQTMTTYLAAQVAPWSEVAETWDLDIGQAYTKTPGKHLPRGFIGDITGAFKGDFDYDKSRTFDVSVGTPGKQTSILDLSKFKLSCDNCFIKGSFTLTGHVSTEKFKLKELTLNASPKDLAATLELGTTIAATESPDTLTHTTELFSAPIPDAGFEVPKIFKLGTTISYDVGISASFSGSASVQYGLDVQVPDTAQITADLHDYSHSSASGFDGGQVNPIFNVTALSAGVTLSAFSQPKLSFGIEVHDVLNVGVDLIVKIPSVDATLSGGYKAGGLCGPGTATTGVQLSSDIGLEVDLNIDAATGHDEEDAKPAFSTKLFGITKPLFSKCFPLQIPGLGPLSTSKSVPSTVPLPTDTGSPTSMLTITGIPTATPIATGSVPGTAASVSASVLGYGNSTQGYRRRVRLA